MDSIKDFFGFVHTFECLECAIAKQHVRSPGGLIFENEFVTVHPHFTYKKKGVIIVSPKTHTDSLDNLSVDERLSLQKAVDLAVEGLKENNYCEEVMVETVETCGHVQVWAVALDNPMITNLAFLRHYESDLAMQRYDITPDSPEEISMCVQKLKTYFKKNF